MSNKKPHIRIRRFCAILIGVVFLLAGVFKLMDPVGAGLVMEEYFRFLHLTFLMPAAKILAVLMALLESFVGAALICGIWRKVVAAVTMVLICFFTLLTLILVIFNPTMECGCFGEVIHLTNMQTFLKNIVLLLLSFAAFIPFGNLGKPKARKDVAFGIAVLSLVAFTVYSYMNIPLMDFTAFTPGSELLAASSDSDDMDSDNGYTSTFIYEKDGQEGVFTLDKLPDSTWTFVRTETIKMNRLETEDNTPMLSFSDTAGVYQDEKAAQGNVLAVSVYDPEKVAGESWTKMSEALSSAAENGFTPLLLVAATPEYMNSLSVLVPEVKENISGSTYFADRKTLVSLNRSNGGATWFNDGQLIRKYRLANLPSNTDLLSMTGADPTESMLNSSTKGRIRFEGFVLYLLAILLLL